MKNRYLQKSINMNKTLYKLELKQPCQRPLAQQTEFYIYTAVNKQIIVLNGLTGIVISKANISASTRYKLISLLILN